MTWVEKLAVNVNVGDVTPAGPVEEREIYDLGVNGKVCLKIDGTWYDRTRRDIVSVEREDAMTEAQEAALRDLSERYKVPFDPAGFRPTFDLPTGYVAGWIGGDERKLYVGCDPEGRISS